MVGDPFEQKLRLWRENLPEGMNEALIYVADTLEFAVAIAKSRLEERWTGADAIEICKLISARHERLSEERERERLEGDADMI